METFNTNIPHWDSIPIWDSTLNSKGHRVKAKTNCQHKIFLYFQVNSFWCKTFGIYSHKYTHTHKFWNIYIYETLIKEFQSLYVYVEDYAEIFSSHYDFNMDIADTLKLLEKGWNKRGCKSLLQQGSDLARKTKLGIWALKP